jgi:release factor glutamine methyltransferase
VTGIPETMHSPPGSVLRLLNDGEAYLKRNGVPNARRNVEWILSHVLRCRMIDLLIDPGRTPNPEQLRRYHTLLERRGSREPLQYILESTEFMSLPFRVLPGVFIPRPDTEVLVEVAERLTGGPPAMGRRMILDLCCGCGAIAVSMIAPHPEVYGVAVDIDERAVALSEANAELNGVRERIRCVRADAVEFLASDDSLYDAVVCNPPYVPSHDIAALPPEIREYEPGLGLDGGEDGMDLYRRVLPRVFDRLEAGGVVAFEISDEQGEAVSELMREASLRDIELHRDYRGAPRVLSARR